MMRTRKGIAELDALFARWRPQKICFLKNSHIVGATTACALLIDIRIVILKTTSKELSTPDAVKEFMDIGGWKARRSGRELSFAKELCIESYAKGILTVRLLQESTDWREWIKTIGDVLFLETGDVDIVYQDKVYHLEIRHSEAETVFTVNIESNTKNDIYFMSALKTVLRKSAYCIGCRVCEANCPNGYISMDNGVIHVDDRCVKCGKCHEVSHGCLVANQ